jgi:tRNA(Ile)-lysidine synthase
VPLYFKKVDAVKFSKENKLTIEQGARILRYSIFDDAIKSGFCDKVATAHHLNDNFESVLLNMFRGTGLKGISGISETNGDIIRPLLSVSRNEIDEYILSNEIPFVEDSTNACSDYSRNYIRNERIL